MSLSTNVPQLSLGNLGPILPEELDVLGGVLSDFNDACGGQLNVSLSTPQGQIATSQAAAIADKNSQLAYFYNQFDPLYASGRMQDAIGRIYFLTRKGATNTLVSCTLTGVSGVVVPAGSLARDSSGNLYTCVNDATIGVSGTVAAVFMCQKTGPIGCPINALNQIYSVVSGWDSINNTTAEYQLGADVENRAEFEIRRSASVAKNAHGNPAAIFGAVFDIPLVTDCYVVDNPSGSSITVGASNTLVTPHSVFVSAVGDTDLAVATAIWTKKSAGCGYNGNTTVTITDTSSFSTPHPTYAITFERPIALPINFSIQVVSLPSLPSSDVVVAAIKAAIVARFNGSDGSQRERIASTIYSARYYGIPIPNIPNLIIKSILVSSNSDPVTNTSVGVGIDQLPTLDVNNISVSIS